MAGWRNATSTTGSTPPGRRPPAADGPAGIRYGSPMRQRSSRNLAWHVAAMCAVAVLVLVSTSPCRAIEVDLELLLAVDISDSIQPDEAQLQRDGYLAA